MDELSRPGAAGLKLILVVGLTVKLERDGKLAVRAGYVNGGVLVEKSAVVVHGRRVDQQRILELHVDRAELDLFRVATLRLYVIGNALGYLGEHGLLIDVVAANYLDAAARAA